MADEKDGRHKRDQREKKSRKPGGGKGTRRDGKAHRDARGHGRQRDGKPRHWRPGVRKTIKDGIGTVFIGQEDPFIYFPDIIALFAREDIRRVELRAHVSCGGLVSWRCHKAALGHRATRAAAHRHAPANHGRLASIDSGGMSGLQRDRRRGCVAQPAAVADPDEV